MYKSIVASALLAGTLLSGCAARPYTPKLLPQVAKKMEERGSRLYFEAGSSLVRVGYTQNNQLIFDVVGSPYIQKQNPNEVLASDPRVAERMPKDFTSTYLAVFEGDKVGDSNQDQSSTLHHKVNSGKDASKGKKQLESLVIATNRVLD